MRYMSLNLCHFLGQGVQDTIVRSLASVLVPNSSWMMCSELWRSKYMLDIIIIIIIDS